MHLTKISALDLAPSNVRVNSVSPVRKGAREKIEDEYKIYK